MAAVQPRLILLSVVAVAAACASGLPPAPPADVAPARPMPSRPLEPGAEIRRVAFGSCFAPQIGEDDIWTSVLAAEPDLFLFLGDNVYQSVETGEPELLELRQAYAQLADVETFARLRDEVPVLATWDDHDYGLNDAGGDFPPKRRSEALFEHVWAVADDDPRRARDGVYGAWILGPPGRRLQVILLDTRFFRSPLKPTDAPNTRGRERHLPDDDPSKTLLGADQWTWLAEQLRQPADVRLIASSIQVVADGHGWEGWFALPRERQRLWDLIAEAGAEGVVLVSGDHHVAGFYRAPAEAAPYPVPEMTSSSLNLPIDDATMREWYLAEPGPNRIGELFAPANFGSLDLEWGDGRVTFNLHDRTGRVVRSLRVPLTELRPSSSALRP